LAFGANEVQNPPEFTGPPPRMTQVPQPGVLAVKKLQRLQCFSGSVEEST
jgi:hypothetical protein